MRGSSFVQNKVIRAGCGVRFRDYLGTGSTGWDVGPACQTHSLDRGFKLRKGQEAQHLYRQQVCLCNGHVHGAIYQEKDHLKAVGKAIKDKQEILNLLEALWLPDISYYALPGAGRLLHLRPGATREPKEQPSTPSHYSCQLPDPGDSFCQRNLL